MTDQMPDEVWVERPIWDGWGEGTATRDENPRVHRVRYIRADLYEQVEADRDTLGDHLRRTEQRLQLVEAELAQSSRAWQQWAVEIEAERDMYKAGLDQHGAYPTAANKELTKAEAGRDRLRAALERIVEPRAWATPEYLRHIAKEALDHD